MIITSLSNKTIKELVKLKTKKERDRQGQYLVDGYHMVNEAIEAGCAKMIITTDEHYQSDLNVLYVNQTVMEKLSFTKTPQPIMAVVEKQERKVEKANRVLIFDGVQDPGNVGTMMRSACAFNFDQVIFSNDSCDLYNDKTLRATQGAIFKMPVIRGDLKEIIPELKEQGFIVVGSALRNAEDITKITVREKMAFIMGNEGQGMKEEILDLCDEALYIPIGPMESLNVGVAAGIIMYTFRK